MMSRMKKGRPISEVTMPSGRMVPGTITLVAIEARMAKTAPTAAVAAIE